MALCLAIICHAIVILGVSFAPEEKPKPRFETMEIVLVQNVSEAPEEADYLAQANLIGGGDSETDERPASPLSTPMPEQAAEVATPPPPSAEPTPREQVVQEAAPKPVEDRPEEPTPNDTPASEAPQEIVTQTATPEQPAPEPEANRAPSAAEAAEALERQSTASRPTPTAAQLIASSFAIASLNAEIQRRLEAKAKRPRRKFISASTREYKFAAYMEAWRAKVERVGNLNYPEEARQNHLSGSLILEVVLQPDGSVKDMIVRRSSGHKALDDAAMRIVELASPFAPFPDEIAKEVDFLHVTRTWQFLNSYRFSSK